MGLAGILHTAGRGAFFGTVLDGYGSHPRGSAEWLAEAFLKTTGGDPEALKPLLDTFVDTSLEDFAGLDLPIAVLCGVDDQDNGSPAELAAALPRGRFVPIPGTHMSAVLKPELGEEISRFLEEVASQIDPIGA
jgi:hypothetical protein